MGRACDIGAHDERRHDWRMPHSQFHTRSQYRTGGGANGKRLLNVFSLPRGPCHNLAQPVLPNAVWGAPLWCSAFLEAGMTSAIGLNRSARSAEGIEGHGVPRLAVTPLPPPPIQLPVTDRFTHVLFGDARGTRKIRNRTRDPLHSVKGARAQAQP